MKEYVLSIVSGISWSVSDTRSALIGKFVLSSQIRAYSSLTRGRGKSIRDMKGIEKGRRTRTSQ